MSATSITSVFPTSPRSSVFTRRSRTDTHARSRSRRTRTRRCAASRTWGPLGMPPILLAVALKRSGNAPGMHARRLPGRFLDDPDLPASRTAVVDGELRTQGQGWRGSTGRARGLRLAGGGSALSLSIHMASIRLVQCVDHRDCWRDHRGKYRFARAFNAFYRGSPEGCQGDC